MKKDIGGKRVICAPRDYSKKLEHTLSLTREGLIRRTEEKCRESLNNSAGLKVRFNQVYPSISDNFIDGVDVQGKGMYDRNSEKTC